MQPPVRSGSTPESFRSNFSIIGDLLRPKSVQYSTLTHLRHDAESLFFNCIKGRRRQCFGRFNLWWVQSSPRPQLATAVELAEPICPGPGPRRRTQATIPMRSRQRCALQPHAAGPLLPSDRQMMMRQAVPVCPVGHRLTIGRPSD